MTKRGVHKSENPPIKRRSYGRIFLWTLLILILLAILVVYLVWVNRFSIVEGQVKSQLAEAGFDVELSITDLTETGAVAKNISVAQNGQELLQAGELSLSYNWRDAMEGRFLGVEILEPIATITIGPEGQIDNPFLAMANSEGEIESGADGPGFVFPPDGVTIRDGQVKLVSPYGTVNTRLNADIPSEEVIELGLLIEPASINYFDLNFTVEGEVNITAEEGGTPQANLDVLVKNWSYKDMSGRDLSLDGDALIKMEPDAILLEGPLKGSMSEFKGEAVDISAIALDWDGEIGITRGSGNILLADGAWKANVGQFGITDKANSREIAEMLSLYSSLASVPVTEDFAAPLTRTIDRLLASASVSGTGIIDKTTEHMEIDLSGPLSWKNENASAILLPSDKGSVFDFQRSEQEIKLAINASLTGPYPMSFKDAELRLQSTNGRNVKRTNSFTGQVSMPRSWETQTLVGLPVRLAPMSASIAYGGPDTNRDLNLSGRVDFDGNIPGGYVHGLKAAGKLNVDLGETTKLYFTPETDSKVSIDRFDSDIPWIATNILFELKPDVTEPLFTLTQETGILDAALENMVMDLASEDNTRTLNISFEEADIKADMTETQDWIIDGRGIYMTSDNMPSVGTVMTAPEALITAFVSADGFPEFTVDAPKADVKTAAVDAKGLAVQVAGKPESFRVDYQDGDISFSGMELPDFKMTGFVNYLDENWVGEADTFLPLGDSTPVRVDYKFVDGIGYADVDVPEIRFSPAGLQPQSFIPALQGKIADVRGFASAKIHMEFSEAGGMTSSGTAQLIDMEMGTLPGPLSGLNSKLKFSSFFPLVTEGPQSVTIDNWDVGIPLPEGIIEFEAIPDGIKVNSAKWPLGTGQISLDPTIWGYTAEENRMQMRIEDVSISEFLGDLGGESFEATGNVSGLMPIVISGVDVKVENGRLAVTDGGVVRFSTPFTDQAGQANGYAQLAFDALKEFYYEELEITMDGPLDGLINIRVVFEGYNPNVMDGAYLRYNLNIEGEILNIIRNFQRLGGQITDEVKSAVLGDDS